MGDSLLLDPFVGFEENLKESRTNAASDCLLRLKYSISWNFYIIKILRGDSTWLGLKFEVVLKGNC